MIERVRYDAKAKRVWINDEQYFGGVEPSAWQFEVGGYPVCEKWLKHRKGRELVFDDIQHFQRTISALSQTIAVMREIEKGIPSWPLR